jgi:hypothetical protein
MLETKEWKEWNRAQRANDPQVIAQNAAFQARQAHAKMVQAENFTGVAVRGDTVFVRGQGSARMSDVTATLETHGDVTMSTSLGKTIAFGALGFAHQNRSDTRKVYLTIDGTDTYGQPVNMFVEVNGAPANQYHFRKIASLINSRKAS